MTLAIFLFPAMGGAAFGYDIGSSSGALVSLTDPHTSGTDWYNLSASEMGVFVSMSLFGALAGSAAALVAGDRLGRRGELQLAAVLSLAGALGGAAAPSYAALLAARGAYGLGIGFAMHAAPAYIAEAAAPSVRGTLIALKEALIVTGVLLGYVGGYVTVGAEGGWRMALGAPAALAVALLLGMTWLPESPRWLLLVRSIEQGGRHC